MKLGGIVIIAALALAGCAQTPPPVTNQVQKYYDENVASSPATPKPVTFAAAGDSITEGNSPNFVGGQVGNTSWVFHARTPALPFEGGWADGGADTATILTNFQPVPVDVIVIVAGTNDTGHGVPFNITAANIEKIVEKSKAPRAVISSIPPRDPDPGLAVDFNTELEAFVKSKGWQWVDGMAGIRDGDKYKQGLTIDGVHPTVDASRIIGETIREAVLARS